MIWRIRYAFTEANEICIALLCQCDFLILFLYYCPAYIPAAQQEMPLFLLPQLTKAIKRHNHFQQSFIFYSHVPML